MRVHGFNHGLHGFTSHGFRGCHGFCSLLSHRACSPSPHLPPVGAAASGRAVCAGRVRRDGGEPYAAQQAKWRAALALALRERLGIDAGRITVLRERRRCRADRRRVGDGRGAAPAFTSYARLKQDDLLLVVLIGHGRPTRRKRSSISSGPICPPPSGATSYGRFAGAWCSSTRRARAFRSSSACRARAASSSRRPTPSRRSS